MSRDRPWSVAVDIAGAQYGGGCSSASGQTWGTQDESTPVFFPESLALGFHSTGRSLGTGRTALLFLGVRRYFSGQSGSHGKDRRGLKRPLFVSGNMCGSLQHARPLTASKLLTESGVVRLERTFPVRMFAHSLGVITSSCGTCEDGNLPNSTLKFRTAGETCLVSWQGGQSRCERSSKGWTYWQDVWTWIGAFDPAFYPLAASHYKVGASHCDWPLGSRSLVGQHAPILRSGVDCDHASVAQGGWSTTGLLRIWSSRSALAAAGRFLRAVPGAGI